MADSEFDSSSECDSESEGSLVVTDEEAEIIKDYQPNRKRPKIMRSPYYNYFNWIPDQKDSRTGKWNMVWVNGLWKCKSCGTELAIPSGGGTSSLKNHVTRRHKHLLVDPIKSVTTGAMQQDIRSLLAKNANVTRPEPITEAGFKERLVNFVVESNQPFTIVEESAFGELISYCSRNAEETRLKCAKTMKKDIVENYEEAKEVLKNVLKSNESKISFIIDCWTSSNQHPFQGIIGTYVNSDWELCTSVIDLTFLEGSHTGENICAAFVAVIDEFCLWENFLALTTDNASNMDTMFVQLENVAKEKGCTFSGNNHRVRCFAHILNLCCQAILKCHAREDAEIENSEHNEVVGNTIIIAYPKSHVEIIIEKIRSAAVSIRGSPQRRQAFKQFCQVKKIPFKMLTRDIDIRWNSTLLMLERAREMKSALEATLNLYPKLRNKMLSEKDWESIDLLIEILTPFREATLMLSSQDSPTLSKTSAIYSALFSHLEKYMPDSSKRSSKNSNTDPKYADWLKQSATFGWEKLSKYYTTSDGEVHIISTVMDPRGMLELFKKANWKKEWIDNSKKKVNDVWKAKYKGGDNSSSENISNNASTSGSSSIFANMFGSATASKRASEDELVKYLAQKVVSPDMLKKELTGVDGALGWWKIHQAEFPCLSKMARDYLGILGSGVAVEQFFCTGGDLVSSRRKRLAPQSITVCMCLQNWKRNQHLKKQMLQNGLKFKILGPEESDDA